MNSRRGLAAGKPLPIDGNFDSGLSQRASVHNNATHFISYGVLGHTQTPPHLVHRQTGTRSQTLALAPVPLARWSTLLKPNNALGFIHIVANYNNRRQPTRCTQQRNINQS